mmetsp:Transcript_27497/g.77089  ORF Transcript_27497/g.77089 Transcript_27497/m.77089 type:complete len:203 (+) Transcript_27497:592-1200(+)
MNMDASLHGPDGYSVTGLVERYCRDGIIDLCGIQRFERAFRSIPTMKLKRTVEGGSDDAFGGNRIGILVKERRSHHGCQHGDRLPVPRRGFVNACGRHRIPHFDVDASCRQQPEWHFAIIRFHHHERLNGRTVIQHGKAPAAFRLGGVDTLGNVPHPDRVIVTAGEGKVRPPCGFTSLFDGLLPNSSRPDGISVTAQCHDGS